MTAVKPVDATVMLRVPLVASVSSAAATVTFCVTFQLAVVKVRLEPAETVRLVSPVDAAVEVTVTLVVGATARRTLYVVVEPSGTVTAVGVTTSDCAVVVSLSASVAVTETGVMPAAVTPMVRDPLTVSASSAAATVTVCGVAKFAGVKVRLAPPETEMSASPVPTVDAAITSAAGADDSWTEYVVDPPSGTFTEVGVTTRLGVGGVPPQATPLTVKAVGLVFVPENDALKPTPETTPPVATVPFHAALLMETWLPVCDQVPAFHGGWLICWLPGNANPMVQLVSGSPLLCRVRSAVKPVGHAERSV